MFLCWRQGRTEIFVLVALEQSGRGLAERGTPSCVSPTTTWINCSIIGLDEYDFVLGEVVFLFLFRGGRRRGGGVKRSRRKPYTHVRTEEGPGSMDNWWNLKSNFEYELKATDRPINKGNISKLMVKIGEGGNSRHIFWKEKIIRIYNALVINYYWNILTHSFPAGQMKK